MTAPARFKQDDMERIFKAAKNAAIETMRVTISPDGTIEVMTGAAVNESLPPLGLD